MSLMLLAAAAVILGGMATALWSFVSAVLMSRKVQRLSRNVTENKLIAISVLATALGSAYLFHASFPGPVARAGSHITIEISSVMSPESKVVMVGDEARAWQKAQRQGAALLFLLPVVLSLLPLLFYAVSIRPFFEGLIAALLAAQLAIGMSGYGVFFLPGALFMLLAAIAALRARDVSP